MHIYGSNSVLDVAFLLITPGSMLLLDVACLVNDVLKPLLDAVLLVHNLNILMELRSNHHMIGPLPGNIHGIST